MAKLLPYQAKREKEFTTKKDALVVILESFRKRVKSEYPKAVFDTEFVLQCTSEEFAAHLESKMQPGMTWENHGDWQVVAVANVNRFDLEDGLDFYRYFHYSNWVPKWKRARGFIADPSKISEVDRDGDSL